MGIESVENQDGGGEWGGVMDWPIIGVHAILTPDNKLLTFGTDQNGMQGGHLIYDVWDIETGTHYTLENQTPTDLFCSVPILVPETGEILIAGGDTRPFGYINYGVEDVNVYDYTDMSISPSPTGDMAYQRWYPTAINLANGKILMVGGLDGNGQGVGMPELYDPGVGWKSLTGAYSAEIADDWWYPRTYLNSDGKVVLFGTNGYIKDFTVFVMDPSGDGSIDAVGNLPFQTNNSLPAIKYEQDKVLILAADGGAWIMDISGDVPQFTQTSDVGGGRLWSNLVLLADGRVMVSGGSAVDNQLDGVSYNASIWDPASGHWTPDEDAQIARLYHSTTILLPDGSILSLGGGAPGPLTNTNGEIYYPDYLFDENGNPAERPVIIDAPDRIEQREDFTITVDDASDITRLTLVKAGSVTHALNMSTTKLELAFAVGPNNTLQVEVTDNANDLSPGQWMLFAFDTKGTPSIAATVQVGLGGEAYNEKLGGFVTLNGDAELVGDIVSLTQDGAGQLGTVMANERISINHDFQFNFNVFLGADDGGADGMAFVLHDAPFGADEVGGIGGGFGAAGIENGLALEIDTYQNNEAGTFDSIANDHTGWIDTDGVGALAQASPVLDVGNIEDGVWHNVQVNWDAQAQVLSYNFDGAQGATITGNLAQTYFGGSDFVTFGFTASSGGATNPHMVEAVSLQATFESGSVLNYEPPPTPPGTNEILGGDAVLTGSAFYEAGSGIVALTQAAPGQVGAIMALQRLDLRQDFLFEFNVFLGLDDGGADGMAFVMHNDPLGANAIGGGGGLLGAAGLTNGLALEFDTWQNGGAFADIANDHTGWIDTDTVGAPANVSASLDLGNIEDGAWHAVQVNWDAQAQSLSYSVDGKQGAVLNGNLIDTYFGGNSFVTFGFTGATGGSDNLQRVQAVSLQATLQDGAAPTPTPTPTPTPEPDPNTDPSSGTVSVMGGDVELSGAATYDEASGVVTLTQDAPGQTGAVMANKRMDLRADFQLSFNVFLGYNDGGADGIAFVLHNDPLGSAGIGGGGGFLGAAGLANGLALEFDTWQNGGAFSDIANDHAGWVDTDTSGAPANVSTSLDLGNIEDGAWHAVQVSWDAETETLSYAVDGVAGADVGGPIIDTFFGGSEFVTFGFTAGTGGSSNLQQVEAISLEAALVDAVLPTPDPDPSPTDIEAMGGAVTLAGGAVYDPANGIVTLTQDAPDQVGGVMSNQRVDLNENFHLAFDIYLGDKDGGADGIAFVLHNDPLGSDAIGGGGGFLGAAGIANGLALEFDTWQNDGAFADLVNDHAGWIDTDSPGAPANVSASQDLGNIEDGAWHRVQVSWDAQTETLDYWVDGVQGQTVAGDIVDIYFGGLDFVTFGFTGGTGGESNLQQVEVLGLDAAFEDGSSLAVGSEYLQA